MRIRMALLNKIFIMSVNFYSVPTNQVGGYIVYGGYRRQRGGGAFGSFRKFMAPIGRQALQGMKSLARNKTVRNIAKQAATKGAEILTTAAVDALQGRNLGEALRERGREVALRTITGEPAATAATTQVASPTATRKRKHASRSKSRKRKVLKVNNFKQRKRLASGQVLQKAPVAKKRRKLSRAVLRRKELF